MCEYTATECRPLSQFTVMKVEEEKRRGKTKRENTEMSWGWWIKNNRPCVVVIVVDDSVYQLIRNIKIDCVNERGEVRPKEQVSRKSFYSGYLKWIKHYNCKSYFFLHPHKFTHTLIHYIHSDWVLSNNRGSYLHSKSLLSYCHTVHNSSIDHVFCSFKCLTQYQNPLRDTKW